MNKIRLTKNTYYNSIVYSSNISCSVKSEARVVVTLGQACSDRKDAQGAFWVLSVFCFLLWGVDMAICMFRLWKFIELYTCIYFSYLCYAFIKLLKITHQTKFLNSYYRLRVHFPKMLIVLINNKKPNYSVSRQFSWEFIVIQIHLHEWYVMYVQCYYLYIVYNNKNLEATWMCKKGDWLSKVHPCKEIPCGYKKGKRAC